MIRPSFQQGYARYASESASPGLRRGMVGAYMPVITGPTGATVHDLERLRSNGTLRNMEPATDWIPTEHGWSLDTDGTDEYVDGASPLSTYGDMTLAVKCKWKTQYPDMEFALSISNPTESYRYAGLAGHRTGGVNYHYMDTRVDGTGVQFAFRASYVQYQWATVIGTIKGTAIRLWVDGLEGVPDTMGTPDNTPTHFQLARRIHSGQTHYANATIAAAMIYDRAISENEVMELSGDVLAPFRLRQKVYAAATVAAAGSAPTGTLYGSLVGPLGGAI